MKVYGLTGKTGAGKSTVAKALNEKGFVILDGDIIARQITEKGSPVLSELADFFGKDIINNDGTLNRKALAKTAFSSEDNRLKLNEITHGAIDKVFRNKISEAEANGAKYVIIDAAALLESPSSALCDGIIVVHAKKETRLKRILSRDNITEEEALRRINAQKDDEYYLSRADFVFKNEDDEFENSFSALCKYLGVTE